MMCTGHTADRGFQFSGAKAAFNPEDRFVVTMGTTLIVCTQNGNVFGHDIAGRNIGPGFKFTGAKAAFNVGDRFVTTTDKTLIVCTQNGDVFGHDIANRNIGPGFKFTGSKAAFNTSDRFVVSVRNRLFGHHTLIVCTQNGDVFGHDIAGRNIGPPFQFTGSKMAFNPEDRFVVIVGNTMIVTTQGSAAFGADVSGRKIGPIFRLNPDLSIRLHLKVWTNPIIPIATMLTSMQDLYGTAGIGEGWRVSKPSHAQVSLSPITIWMLSKTVLRVRLLLNKWHSSAIATTSASLMLCTFRAFDNPRA